MPEKNKVAMKTRLRTNTDTTVDELMKYFTGEYDDFEEEM